jgi:phage shock protein C
MPDRLERSTTNRQWSGVCGGIAEYFQVDPTLVRAFFVIATIFSGGLFVLVYVALIVLMPVRGQSTAGTSITPTSSGDPAAPPAQSFAPTPDDPAPAARRREAAGWLLVALGIVFLLANVGAFRLVQWNYIWPVALIAIGVYIVLQRSRS